MAVSSDLIKAEKVPIRLGVSVADNESNPAMTRLYDAVGMVAGVGNSLTDKPRNDFDHVFPFNGITEETVNGRVMIRIPKFYVRREYSGGVREWTISNVKYDDSYVPHEMFLKGETAYTGSNPESDYNDFMYVGRYETSSMDKSVSGVVPQVSVTNALFQSSARAIGDGWTQLDLFTWSGLQTLFMVEFATRNSKSVMLGNMTPGVNDTGLTKGQLASSVQISDQAMSYRGIENLYGNVAKYLVGVAYTDVATSLYTKISQYADRVNQPGARNLGYAWASDDRGFISRLGYDPNNKFAEFPVATAGSTTTYYCNYGSPPVVWASFNYIALVSGSYGFHLVDGAGLFFFVSQSTTEDEPHVLIGSRLAYRPV